MTDTRDEMSRSRKLLTILKFALLIIVVVGIPLYIYLMYPEVLREFDDLDSINALLERYKGFSVLVYLGLQIFQIVVSVLPGQVLQFSSGYFYGFWFGYLFSIVGVALGTIITFYLARLLGKDAMYLLFGEKRFSRFVELLNRKKAHIVIFVIYLVPGIPKDLISYAAGVSEFRLEALLLLSLVGRTPAMMVSIVIGQMTRSENYTWAIILAGVAVILFILCIVKRKMLMAWADQLYNKLNQ